MALRDELPIYLACDIDETLRAGHINPKRKIGESEQALDVLTNAVIAQRSYDQDISQGAPQNIPFYYGTVTGRTLGSHQLLERESDAFLRAVMAMDVVIGSVGAEIAERREDKFVPILDWPGSFAEWDREEAQRVLDAARGIGRLALQEPLAQSGNKLSYFVEGLRVSEGYAGRVSRLLGDVGIKTTVIFSAGKFLDILPKMSDDRNVDKGAAIEFTAEYLANRDNLPVLPRVIFAGDSENDEAAIAHAIDSGGMAIIPENASLKFKHRMRVAYDPSKRLHVAEQPYAAGVQEGLKHFGVLAA